MSSRRPGRSTLGLAGQRVRGPPDRIRPPEHVPTLIAPPPRKKDGGGLMVTPAARFVITCAGREFVVTEHVAARFRTRAQRIIDSGETGPVPLLRSHGVEVLIIRSAGPCNIATPYEIREVQERTTS